MPKTRVSYIIYYKEYETNHYLTNRLQPCVQCVPYNILLLSLLLLNVYVGIYIHTYLYISTSGTAQSDLISNVTDTRF